MLRRCPPQAELSMTFSYQGRSWWRNIAQFRRYNPIYKTDHWVYRALNGFVVDRDGDYPGEDYFMVEGDRRCNHLAGVYLFPLPESWELGDRAVACLMEE